MKDPLTITTERVDDIPLLLAQMQRMGLARLLDAHFPTHGNRQGLSLGVVTTIWVTHLLSQEVIYMIIRTIRPDDAEQFLCLCLQLDEETQFMLLEPGERTISVEQQQKQIEDVLS